eukprot:CAMPEP_0177677282 /NCGR_PEP_ID=MMETSP0447-20121125/28295_1 /TAXON_ID=0 /ORGANISM="Stygamoeba regulata, Strain BSH-02190019" /LENGTH=87 /DNA_ID=CAMNT_0019186013 /DNA_START=22 /DNA_END=282 /DNA_ORIENTATION=-
MSPSSHANCTHPSMENSPYASISHRVTAPPHGPTSPNPATTTTCRRSTAPRNRCRRANSGSEGVGRVGNFWNIFSGLHKGNDSFWGG